MRKIAFLLVFAFLCNIIFLSCAKNSFKAEVFVLSGLEEENYSFAVKKGDPENLLGVINSVIANINNNLPALVNYYSKIYLGQKPGRCPVTIPDASSNSKGVLRIGTSTDFGLFEFIIKDRGNIQGAAKVKTGVTSGKYVTGLDIAIMMLVADKLDKKLEIIDICFDSLQSSLSSQAGTVFSVDIIAAAYSKTEAREVISSFSDSYHTAVQSIICKKALQLDSLDKLNGKRIGVQSDTTGEFLISDAIESEALSGSTLQTYGRVAEAFIDLKKRKIDAIILDDSIAELLVGK